MDEVSRSCVGRLDGRGAVFFSRVAIGQAVLLARRRSEEWSVTLLLCQVTQAQIVDLGRDGDRLRGSWSDSLAYAVMPFAYKGGVGELAEARSLEVIRKGCKLQTLEGSESSCVVAADSHWLSLPSQQTPRPIFALTGKSVCLNEVEYLQMAF